MRGASANVVLASVAFCGASIGIVYALTSLAAGFTAVWAGMVLARHVPARQS